MKYVKHSSFLPRHARSLLLLFVAVCCILVPAHEILAKDKSPAGYIRVWMAIVDHDFQYSLTTQMPGDDTPANLFGPAKADYGFDNYSKITPGQYDLHFKRITANGEVSLGEVKLDVKDGEFFTLFMRPDAQGNPKLVILNDTLVSGANTPPVAHIYNFVANTPLSVTSGSESPLSIPPFAGPIEIKNPDSLHAAFRSKDGDNLNLELPLDLKLTPVHSVLLVRDSYGDIFPRTTNDGVIVK